MRQGQFFRFVNATPENLTVLFDNLPLQSPYMFPYGVCSFRKDAPRAHRVIVKDESGKVRLDEKIHFKGGDVVTYVLAQKGGSLAVTPYSGENRNLLTDGSEVRLLSEKESVSAGIFAQGKDATKAALSDKAVPLSSGEYKILVGDKVIAHANLESGIAYSVLVHPKGKGLGALLLRNSPEPMETTNASVSQSAG